MKISCFYSEEQYSHYESILIPCSPCVPALGWPDLLVQERSDSALPSCAIAGETEMWKEINKHIRVF